MQMMLGSCLHELCVAFGAAMATRNEGPDEPRDRNIAQIMLILDGLTGAAAYPAPDRWGEVDNVEYLYREYAILVREKDAARVVAALAQILDQVGYGDVPEGQAREIQREPVSSEIVRLTVPRTPTLVPDLVERLDEALGPGVATPEHVLYIGFTADPEEVPDGLPPDPGVSRESDDGDGVLVAVLDSGLLPDAAGQHYWLAGVDGTLENPFGGDPAQILPYAGHGTFVAWYDRKILPGEEWDREINENLNSADIILLLASPDFLASDYIDSRELSLALERRKSRSAIVVPIIVRPSDWQNSPLGNLKALPGEGRPVSRWPNRDEAWLDVVRGLRQLISRQE